MNHLRKFIALTKDEKAVFAHALVLLAPIAVILRLVGLRRCQWMMAFFSPMQETAWLTAEQSARVGYLVNVAAYRGPYPLYLANCLVRSLALWFLLRRRGVASDLRIGVSKRDRDLKAHAWIEVQGVVLNDAEDVGRWFAPFDNSVREFSA